ncbi:hypothetical protein [Egbenema bharatensis]|uniref:hypothetical protein n=1 Tax=Egbenema bharatensis TaxID=3463334 RepID=UPI003A8A55F4
MPALRRLMAIDPQQLTLNFTVLDEWIEFEWRLISMRYSIMLQLVTIITIILVSAAGWFAWLQNRQPGTGALESSVNREMQRETEETRSKIT